MVLSFLYVLSFLLKFCIAPLENIAVITSVGLWNFFFWSVQYMTLTFKNKTMKCHGIKAVQYFTSFAPLPSSILSFHCCDNSACGFHFCLAWIMWLPCPWDLAFGHQGKQMTKGSYFSAFSNCAHFCLELQHKGVGRRSIACCSRKVWLRNYWHQ